MRNTCPRRCTWACARPARVSIPDRGRKADLGSPPTLGISARQVMMSPKPQPEVRTLAACGFPQRIPTEEIELGQGMHTVPERKRTMAVKACHMRTGSAVMSEFGSRFSTMSFKSCRCVHGPPVRDPDSPHNHLGVVSSSSPGITCPRPGSNSHVAECCTHL